MTPNTVAPQRPLRSVQRREGSNTQAEQARRSGLSSASGRYASAKDGAGLGRGCTSRYLILAASGSWRQSAEAFWTLISMPMRPPEPRYHYGIGAPKVELRLSGRSCSLAGWSHSNSTWSGHAGLPDSAAQERSTRQATGTWKDLDLGLNRVDGSSNRSRASTLQPSNDVRGLTHQQRPDPIARDRCQRLSDESWTAG